MSSVSVIIPLYQYPQTPATWCPLYRAFDQHPNILFVVIVNPNSGPGKPPSPDAHYSHEIPRLNARPNVQTIGYVATDYCRRNMTDVVKDIGIYSGWSSSSKTPGVYVQGIFFDETPNHWSAQVADYLYMITTEVKNSTGIKGNRLVMHNPGTVPDTKLAKRQPNITAVFEASYSDYQSQSRKEQRRVAKLYDRAGASIIVHSTPMGEIKKLVDELRPRAEYLFVTDLRERYYESFGTGWKTFIDAIAAGTGVADNASQESLCTQAEYE